MPGDSKLKIYDKRSAFAAGIIDPSLPVVPPLEIAFAVPVAIPPADLRPVPCSAPLDFFDKILQEEYAAGHIFEDKFKRDPASLGELGDRVGDLHASINVAGKVLHGLCFYVLEFTDTPEFRFIINKIENLWLDFNAHAWRVALGLELRFLRELQERFPEVAGSLARFIPESEPVSPAGQQLFASPSFAMFLPSAVSGSRLARLKGGAITFEGQEGHVTTISLTPGSSPRQASDQLCSLVAQLLQEEIGLLESGSISSAIPPPQTMIRDAVRAKFFGSPCNSPQFFILYHFDIHSTHAQKVPLEPSEITVVDKTLTPGATAWVAIRSWEADGQADENTYAYPDSPVPEARESFIQFIRAALPAGEGLLGDRVVNVPPEVAGSLLVFLKERMLAHCQGANQHRSFVVEELPSETRAAALGKAHPPNTPTQALGNNVFNLTNAKRAPLHVQYVAARKTYTITITFARASVLYWDGATRVEIGHEKLAGFLTAILRPEVNWEASPVLAAFQEASARGVAMGSCTFPVELFKPIAAPKGYIERHVTAFYSPASEGGN